MKKAYYQACIWRANPNKAQIIDENQFSLMSVSIAYSYCYTKPKTTTGHGSRYQGISLVGNCGVGPFTIKQFSRHINLNQSTIFHENDEAD